MRGNNKLQGVLYNQRRSGVWDVMAGALLVLFIGGSYYQVAAQMSGPGDTVRTAESEVQPALTPMDEYVRQHDPQSQEAAELGAPNCAVSGT